MKPDTQPPAYCLLNQTTLLHTYCILEHYFLFFILLNVSIYFGKLLVSSTTVMTGSLNVFVNKRCKSLGSLRQKQEKEPLSKIASGNHYRLFLAISFLKEENSFVNSNS